MTPPKRVGCLAIIRKLLVSFGVFCSCVILLEVLLEWSNITRDDNLLFGNMLQHAAVRRDPDLIWSLRAGFDTATVSNPPRHPYPHGTTYSFKINSRSRRAPEFQVPPATDHYRILTFGDSTTFGVWVRDEQTWPALVETELRSKLDNRFEVINCGVPGYSLSQGFRDYQLRASAYKPRCVVAAFCGFNGSELQNYNDSERFALLALFRPFYKLAMFDIAVKVASLPRFDHVVRREQIQEFRSIYRQWIRLCREADIEFLAVVLPRQRQISYQTIPPNVRHNLQDLAPAAAIAEQQGLQDQARELYRKALEESDLIFNEVTEQEIKSLVVTRASTAVSSMQAENPTLIALNNEGLKLWHEGDYEAATQILEQSVTTYPEFAMSHYYLGVCYLTLNRQEWASRSFSRAQELTRSGVLAHQIAVHQIAAQEGVPVVDLLMSLQLKAVPDLFIDSGHTGPEGYTIIGTEISRSLRMLIGISGW